MDEMGKHGQVGLASMRAGMHRNTRPGPALRRLRPERLHPGPESLRRVPPDLEPSYTGDSIREENAMPTNQPWSLRWSLRRWASIEPS